MKKLLLSAGLALVAANGFGQGQLIFANSADRIITNAVTGAAAAGETRVGLYLGNVGDPVSALSLVAVTNCSSGGRFSGGTRTFAGWTGTVQLQVRCWLADTDSSVIFGVSQPFNFTLTTAPSLPVSISGSMGFVVLNFSTIPPPDMGLLSATVLGTNSANGTRNIRLSALVNTYSSAGGVKFRSGSTMAYGVTNSVSLPAGFPGGSVAVTQAFAPGLTYHWNVEAVSPSGTAISADQSFAVAPLGSGVPGDVDGDGLVSQSELDAVYARYLGNGPPLSLTGVAGLGSTNVSFAIPGAELGSYTVEYSTNLTDWLPLGSVAPRYGFTDPSAPGFPVRQYRLRYP